MLIDKNIVEIWRKQQLNSLKQAKEKWTDPAWQRSCWWRPARHEAETHDERNEADDQSDMLLNLTGSRHDHDDQPIMFLKCIFLPFYWLLNDGLTTWRGDNRYGSAEVVMTAGCLFSTISLHKSFPLKIT